MEADSTDLVLSKLSRSIVVTHKLIAKLSNDIHGQSNCGSDQPCFSQGDLVTLDDIAATFLGESNNSKAALALVHHLVWYLAPTVKVDMVFGTKGL